MPTIPTPSYGETMKDNELVASHQEGARYLWLRQFYPVRAWGSDAGIRHGLEFSDTGDSEHIDVIVKTANSGTFADAAEHAVTLRLPADQVDLLIGKLLQIRDLQRKQMAEREAWETAQQKENNR